MEFEKGLEIGVLGEQVFSVWCTSASLNSNRSLEEDRTGWDHQIEFPYLKTVLPRDKQPSPIQCRVQVKSTQRKDRSWSIKATVLKSLIDYSYPAFFLFLEFSDDAEPYVENAFLVHIDKNIIEKTLKKIRRNDTLKSSKELFKVKVSISYNKTHRLPEATGLAFRTAVINNVPDGNITKYQESKIHYLNTVGYEQFGYEFKFDVKPRALDEYFTAAAIGTVESIDIENATILDNRFNLQNGSVEIKRSEVGKLRVLPNVIDSCQLRFKASIYSPSINFDGEFVSVAQVFLKTQKLIFRTSLFSIELGESEQANNDNSKIVSECKLYLTIDKSATIDEIIRLLKLFSTKDLSKKLLLEVDLKETKRTLKFEVNFNYEFPNDLDVIDALGVLKNSFEIDGSTLTRFDEVCRRKDSILHLANALQNNIDGFQFNLNNRKYDSPKKMKTIHYMIVQLGTKAVGAIFLFYGLKDGNSHNYIVYKSRILKPLVFHDGMPKQSLLDQLAEEELSNIRLKDE